MEFSFAEVPPPFCNESLASWLQRLCQIYDLSFPKFQKIFSTSGNTDPDLFFSTAQFHELLEICGVSKRDALLIDLTFCRFLERPNLRALLLDEQVDGYSYRFCPTCFAEDPVPYLRIEWRFRTTEYCFAHHCDLKNSCGKCGKHIPILRTILSGSNAPAPVAHLAICLFCRESLSSPPALTKFEGNAALQLRNRTSVQKAIVAAVIHDYFVVHPFLGRYSLDLLPRIVSGIGLELLFAGSDAPPHHLGTSDLDSLRKILESTFRGNTWLQPGHARRQRLIRKSKALTKNVSKRK